MLMLHAFPGDAVVASYNCLAAESVGLGELRWPLRPKHHGLCHLVCNVRRDRRNPKYYGCMLDEDFLGRTVRVARVCSRRTVSYGVLSRYIVRVMRRWRGSVITRRLHYTAVVRAPGRPFPACL